MRTPVRLPAEAVRPAPSLRPLPDEARLIIGEEAADFAAFIWEWSTAVREVPVPPHVADAWESEAAEIIDQHLGPLLDYLRDGADRPNPYAEEPPNPA